MKLIDLLKTLPVVPTDKGPLILFNSIFDACRPYGLSKDTLEAELRSLEKQGSIKTKNCFDDGDPHDFIYGIYFVE